jgi:argininosuccinate synthase
MLYEHPRSKVARHVRDAGGTILLAAHRGIEQITLHRAAAHLKDEMMPRYAEFLYTRVWCSPKREMQALQLRRSGGYVFCKPAPG